MESKFISISPYDLKDNIFKLIDKDWMLVTAGNLEHFNTMTASWGHMGIMWNMPVAIAFIRPQRYTYSFMNKNAYYTLSFFSEKYRKALQFCGTKSGRDYDKIKETGLSPLETESGNVYFKEASLVIECEKIYQDDLKKENFLSADLVKKHYPIDDFHRFYMGLIQGVYLNKEML
jgi:flavin reductase (DIM6/NTAB) family NADH-FMN oxidoreductase RutF